MLSLGTHIGIHYVLLYIYSSLVLHFNHPLLCLSLSGYAGKEDIQPITFQLYRHLPVAESLPIARGVAPILTVFTAVAGVFTIGAGVAPMR